MVVAFAGARTMSQGVFVENFSKLKDLRIERSKKNLFLRVKENQGGLLEG
jgi:hypothetical protein